MGLRWYVVKLVPKQEHWASQNIHALGFDTYWPRFSSIVKKGNKSILRCKAVFPGYMFVEFDVDDGGWRRINGLHGVRRLMMSGDYVPALPVGFVENMLRVSENGIIEEEKNFMRICVGDVLRVTGGALEGKIGICQNSESGRVAILLTLLGRQTRVSLPQEMVEPASKIM